MGWICKPCARLIWFGINYALLILIWFIHTKILILWFFDDYFDAYGAQILTKKMPFLDIRCFCRNCIERNWDVYGNGKKGLTCMCSYFAALTRHTININVKGILNYSMVKLWLVYRTFMCTYHNKPSNLIDLLLNGWALCSLLYGCLICGILTTIDHNI